MKTLHIDSQILSTIAKCPRAAYHQYVERLESKDVPASIRTGAVVHRALEIFYKNYNLPYEEKVSKSIDTIIEEYPEFEGLPSIIDTLGEYFKYRKTDSLIVHEVEVPFSTLLYSTPDLEIYYEGRIDLICEDNGELVIFDHKTTKINFEPTDLQIQFLGYTWATGLKVIVNRIGLQKTKTPSEKFRRFIMKFEKDVIESFEKFAIEKSLEWADFLNRNEYPQNFGSCEGKYGACKFIELCRYPTLAEETKKFSFVRSEEWDVFNGGKNR